MADMRPELILIRHAPVAVPGRLAGRTDFEARLDPAQVAQTRERVPQVAAVVSSPARRCVATARALFDTEIAQEPLLWEQHFGEYDGAELSSLPDLGALSGAALAAHRWPGGESFAEVCDRVAPVLQALAQQAETEGKLALVVHAGVIRAALAQVLGSAAAGLACEVAPLSVTRLGVWQGAPVSVRCVNEGGL